nr:hypothetical protein [uncultured Dongia sp.]
MSIRGSLAQAATTLVLLLAVAAPAGAEDPLTVAGLERQAVADFVAGQYGAADEKIRAAIGLADNEEFNRLALLQGLIATRMGGDGRSLLGAAIGAHESTAWPRPIITYLLGERSLQQVADEVRRSGDTMLVKQQHICELSFYAGAFALADGEQRFARQLFDKALAVCDRADPALALTMAEVATLKAP